LRSRPPADSLQDAVGRGAGEVHRAFLHSAVEQEQRAFVADPALVPATPIPVEEVEALSPEPVGALPVLVQDAASQDGVHLAEAEVLAASTIDHAPASQPEIERAQVRIVAACA